MKNSKSKLARGTFRAMPVFCFHSVIHCSSIDKKLNAARPPWLLSYAFRTLTRERVSPPDYPAGSNLWWGWADLNRRFRGFLAVPLPSHAACLDLQSSRPDWPDPVTGSSSRQPLTRSHEPRALLRFLHQQKHLRQSNNANGRGRSCVFCLCLTYVGFILVPGKHLAPNSMVYHQLQETTVGTNRRESTQDVSRLPAQVSRLVLREIL